MRKRQKRVVAIHDISCVGKCSLTVALPIISAMGVEASLLPTAVLSTHTGGFTGYTYRDLTEDIRPIADHWALLGLTIDAIYTGYLGSFEQLSLVSEFFDRFGNDDNLIVVDPAMADNGVLYTGFTPAFAKGMAKLCGQADLIVPNITEAAMMTDVVCREGPYDKAYIEKLLRALGALGPKQVVLTGVWFKEAQLGAAVYDSLADRAEYVFGSKIDGYYHGTGDIFASVVVGALLNGLSLKDAAQLAVDFTRASIQITHDAGTERRYGVAFEQCLPMLMQKSNA